MHARIAQVSIATFFLVVAGSASAETVVPLKGQSPDQIQSDITACKAQASNAEAVATAPTPSSTTKGGRLRGAAAGAAVGSAAAQVRGNQHEGYDQIDDDVKQEYRQENAKDAAVAGAVVGGMKQRQEGRQAMQQPAAAPPQGSTDAYNTCMTGAGYSVTP
jgi:hypothetical protein